MFLLFSLAMTWNSIIILQVTKAQKKHQILFHWLFWSLWFWWFLKKRITYWYLSGGTNELQIIYCYLNILKSYSTKIEHPVTCDKKKQRRNETVCSIVYKTKSMTINTHVNLKYTVIFRFYFFFLSLKYLFCIYYAMCCVCSFNLVLSCIWMNR